MKPSLSTRKLGRYAATRSLAIVASAALLIAAHVPSFAAFTDLADSPLSTSASVVVKPNILFTLDDSGSMGWVFMPDGVFGNINTVGYKNHLCNSMYYNPSTVYVPPKNPDGSNFPNASFTAAKNNGFVAASPTRDLTNNFIAYDSITSAGAGTDAAQPAYYYAASGGGDRAMPGRAARSRTAPAVTPKYRLAPPRDPAQPTSVSISPTGIATTAPAC